MKPGPVDIARVKRQPQRTKVHLGIYKPEISLSCQVNNGSIAKGAHVIAYDNVTAGDWSAVMAGMTLLIGGAPGKSDYGKLRIRDIDATEITVAENYSVDWKDDLYLTVIRFFEPWGVYPRIVLDGNNVPTWYKDYDIPFSDQTLRFDPVVHMGPHTARFLETGTASIFYSSSGTFDPTDGSVPTGSEWWFEGATVTGSLDAHPGLIQYQSPGHYTTHLEVTSNFGKTFVGHRHVMIFDKIGEGSNTPIINWGLAALEGSRKSGGYSTRLWVREPADMTKVVDGALVVLFTEDWYGDEKVSIGGNAIDRSNILFVGYIDGESIRYNSYTSRLDFRAESIAGIGDVIQTFSDALNDVQNASDWYEMPNMTVDKAIVNYLRWQTTLLSIADFKWTGDVKRVQYIDLDRGGIYSAANDLYDSSLGARLVADRQGALFAEVDVNYTATGTRSLVAYPQIYELERSDWADQVVFDRDFNDALSYLEHGGIAYSGPATGTWDPFLSGAPGDAPSYTGGVARKSGLVLTGQEQLNQFAGNMFAAMNSNFPRVDVMLSGDYRFIDIAPQEFILLTLEESDTFRGLIWDKKRLVAETISYRYDSRQDLLRMEVTLKEETSGPPGETLEIPVDPPYDSPDLPEWDIEFPPIPPFPSLIPVITPPPGTGNLVYVLHEKVLARTRNFFDASPNWETIIIPSSLSMTNFGGFILDPSDPNNTALLYGESVIWKTNDLDSANPAWVLVYSNTQYPTHLINSVDHVKPWINGRLWSAAVFRSPSASGCPTPFAPCLMHVRAGPTATGWVNYTAGISKGNVGSPGMVQPTTFAGGSVYISSEFAYYYSQDAGVSFIKQWDDPPKVPWPQPLSHLGNSAGNLLYIVRETAAGVSRRFYVSDDFGLTVTDISMPYDSVFFAPYAIDSSRGQQSENFWIHPKTGVAYSMLFEPTKAYGVFGQYSTAWLPKVQFTGIMGPMMINYSDNGEHQYSLGAAVGERIVGSEDFGNNWLNKEGDFATAVLPWASAGLRLAMQVVWTV